MEVLGLRTTGWPDEGQGAAFGHKAGLVELRTPERPHRAWALVRLTHAAAALAGLGVPEELHPPRCPGGETEAQRSKATASGSQGWDRVQAPVTTTMGGGRCRRQSRARGGGEWGGELTLWPQDPCPEGVKQESGQEAGDPRGARVLPGAGRSGGQAGS